MQRRKFLYTAGVVGTAVLSGCGTPTTSPAAATPPPSAPEGDLWFDISLAQWSLHKALFAGEIDNLDFAGITRNTYGLDGAEYVNVFFKDHAKDQAYLAQMKQRAADHDVRSLLIMVDGEGNLGATDANERTTAVENHYKWIDAAHYLGCHSIRVNAAGRGSREEVAAAAADGLRRLGEYGQQAGLNVIVENHGGYSSDGGWLAGVIAATEQENCGTLPDFGNFCMERSGNGCAKEYDRYQGVREMMPYAKAVSAKTHDFDKEGNEIHTDYRRMLGIVKQHGYRGWMGIEYEGNSMTPDAGIKATIALLRKVGAAV
ncbi:sugar phosphate isomerase/epimerase [Lewinella aquimaris]|uniref:Sugar phosphate isomerase/epimerase n=1 Tax=Neolewinella aquimaris TaxID=1835722 RepID=A0A840E2Z6_9BACT|nr:sugar phosphate isomerase/epimerase family protein [Neolewinella aquimaris]MBB4079954.1 sugar phosphate isomerase/epimerase [Neolewinella aquimaris]